VLIRRQAHQPLAHLDAVREEAVHILNESRRSCAYRAWRLFNSVQVLACSAATRTHAPSFPPIRPASTAQISLLPCLLLLLRFTLYLSMRVVDFRKLSLLFASCSSATTPPMLSASITLSARAVHVLDL
jgi:hypothetical protein